MFVYLCLLPRMIILFLSDYFKNTYIPTAPPSKLELSRFCMLTRDTIPIISWYQYQCDISAPCLMHALFAHFAVRRLRKAASSDVTQTTVSNSIMGCVVRRVLCRSVNCARLLMRAGNAAVECELLVIFYVGEQRLLLHRKNTQRDYEANDFSLFLPFVCDDGTRTPPQSSCKNNLGGCFRSAYILPPTRPM